MAPVLRFKTSDTAEHDFVANVVPNPDGLSYSLNHYDPDGNLLGTVCTVDFTGGINPSMGSNMAGLPLDPATGRTLVTYPPATE